MKRPSIFLDVSERLHVPVESSPGEVLRGLLVLVRHAHRHQAEHTLHHGQVLQVVQSLEQSVSDGKLEDDAADGPDIARLSPPLLQNYFRSSIMPSLDDPAVVLVVECCAAEVYKSDGRVENLLVLGVAGRGAQLKLGVPEQDVLGLEIRVSEAVVVEEIHGLAKVVSHSPHMLYRIGLKVIFFLKVVDTFSKDLERYAHMSVVVKPVQHADAKVLPRGIVAAELRKNVDFHFGIFPVIFDIFDNLHGVNFISPHIQSFDNSPESSLAKCVQNFISISQDVPLTVYEVSLHVVVNAAVAGASRPLSPRALPLPLPAASCDVLGLISLTRFLLLLLSSSYGLPSSRLSVCGGGLLRVGGVVASVTTPRAGRSSSSHTAQNSHGLRTLAGIGGLSLWYSIRGCVLAGGVGGDP